MSAASKKYRYPGINSFEEAQKDRFHGRSKESEQLCALLMQEKLTVLFGKSGYGKTSLLNAGVRPLLLEKSSRGKRRYLPVSIRFNAWNGEETLLDKFARQFAIGTDLPLATHGVALPPTLWGTVRNLASHPITNNQSTNNQSPVFVLLFDQFEEFFTYPPEQQQDFKNQLAELLYADYPYFLEQNEATLRPEQIAALADRLEVRTLFSIRADRLHELDRLSDRLYAILHKRIELHALPRTEAEKAIVLPAARPQSEGFAGAPFAFDRPALDRILDFLADDQQRVETNQLQILCDSFEKRAIAEGITAFNPDNLGDLKQVIARYYHDKIADIADPNQRLAVQRLCEEGLAQEGEPPIRLSLHEAQIARIFHIPAAMLSRLVDQRLLRAEAGAGGGYVYELPHDTLLLPVLEAKRIRQEAEAAAAERLAAEEALRRAKEAEAQAALEKQRAEEAEKLKNEAVRGRKRARVFAMLAGVVAILAVGIGAFAIQQRQTAIAAKDEADTQLVFALEEKQQRWDLEIKDLQRKQRVYELAENAILIRETKTQIDSISNLQKQNLQAISQLKQQ